MIPEEVVFAKEAPPKEFSKSIFLAGPTHRTEGMRSWRIQALGYLHLKGFDGTVFVPEERFGQWQKSYIDQVEWEADALSRSDVVLFWVPRDLEILPGFTTNVEFGEWMKSGRVVYGRPEGAPKTRYLDHKAEKHCIPTFDTLNETLDAAMARLEDDTIPRAGAHQKVPQEIWKSAGFSTWMSNMSKAGNSLQDFEVLWSYHVGGGSSESISETSEAIREAREVALRQLQNSGRGDTAFKFQRVGPRLLFAWAAQVSVWIESEGRSKTNEFIICRPDIACVALSWQGSHVIMMNEFRSPVNNPNGYVLELPGGSAFTPKGIKQLAQEEVNEEVGLSISLDRLKHVASRQLASTILTHQAHLFQVDITVEEYDQILDQIDTGKPLGNEEDSERVWLLAKNIKDIDVWGANLDWTMRGMLAEALP